MAGEDPVENGFEMMGMKMEDYNHAAELDWEEEELLKQEGIERRYVWILIL